MRPRPRCVLESVKWQIILWCMIFLSLPRLIIGEKTHIFAPCRFSSRVKAKGKRHVSFPFCRLYPHETSLQAVSSTPLLTLAIPAVIAFLTPLLVHHRIAPTLRAEIARDLQATQAGWCCEGITVPIPIALFGHDSAL